MAVGNGYSSAQILSMQKDAIRRVNEMQRLSQERLRKTRETLAEDAVDFGESLPSLHMPDHRTEKHSHPSQGEPPPILPPGQSEEQALPTVSTKSSPENPLKGILQRLNLDQETILVLLLLLMLVNEGADSKLIMALVYILI